MARIPIDDAEQSRLIHYIEQAWEDRGMAQSVYRNLMWASENICDSPIERRMLAALMFCPFGYYDDLNQIVAAKDAAKAQFLGDNAIIVPEAPIPGTGYRVDFLVYLSTRHVKVSPNPCFAVECDGHDFHEKTKQQAARDKKRDREIQAKGIPIFRFTGSEIHQDVQACVDQLDGYGSRVLEKLWGLK